MAHTFDSGKALAQRTLVRRGAVAALAELRRQSPGTKYLAAVVELPAPLVGEAALEFLKAALGTQLPAVAIACGPRSFAPNGTANREWRGSLQVHVYVCTAHARGLVDGRTAADVVALADDTADPGLDTMAEHVFERLTGLHLPAANAAELRPVSEDIAFVDQDLTVFEQVYSVEVFTDVNPKRSLTQVATDLDTTHTDSVAGDPSAIRTVTELVP